MTKAWMRYWEITVDRYKISSVSTKRTLDAAFDVESSTSRQPNKAKLQIFNFPKEYTRSLPSQPEIQVVAGYQDSFGTIFSGQGEKVTYNRSDILTTSLDVEASDGGLLYRNPSLSANFGANTRVVDVLKHVLDQMGLGHGNLPIVESQIKLASGNTTYAEGVSVNGAGRRYVQRILSASGLRWSIQNGNIQIRSGENPVDSNAVLLEPGTGLIGSPAIDSDGKVSCVAQLIPTIYPGRLIVLRSSVVEGNFSAKKCKYVGKTPGDWKIDIALENY